MKWTDVQLAQYHKQGYLLVPGLLSEKQVTSLTIGAQEICNSTNDDLHREWEPNGSLRQVYLVHRHNHAFHQLSLDPKLIEPVRQILNSDFYVWHSKLNVKCAFAGSAWLWHQDYGYWKLEGTQPRMVTVGVFLDRTGPDNGCLVFIAGSQKWGLLEHENTPTQRYIKEERFRDKASESAVRYISGELGDVFFFDCNLVHRSGPNLSTSTRRIFLIAYNDINNRPQLPQRPDWVVAHVFDICR